MLNATNKQKAKGERQSTEGIQTREYPACRLEWNAHRQIQVCAVCEYVNRTSEPPTSVSEALLPAQH